MLETERANALISQGNKPAQGHPVVHSWVAAEPLKPEGRVFATSILSIVQQFHFRVSHGKGAPSHFEVTFNFIIQSRTKDYALKFCP